MPGPEDRLPDKYNIDELFDQLIRPTEGGIKPRSARVAVERFMDADVPNPHTSDFIAIRLFIDQVLPDQLAALQSPQNNAERLRAGIGELSDALLNHETAEDPSRIPPASLNTLSAELRGVQRRQGILADVKELIDDIRNAPSEFGQESGGYTSKEDQQFRSLLDNFSDTLELVMRQMAKLARDMPRNLTKED